jgi:anti-sigma factor RsiW
MTYVKNAEHDAVIELLPWYVTGTLNPTELKLVNQHLPDCLECQQEIALYRQIDKANSANNQAQSWQPSPAQFSSLLQSIDELEKKNEATKTQAQPHKRTPIWSTWLKSTPKPIFWFMSLETVALAALVLLVVGRLPQHPEQLYKTLSNEQPAISENLAHLHIVFTEDITEREIRSLLEAEHAQIVQGPSILGVYTLQLSADGTKNLQQTINGIRASPKIKLVEKINGSNKP